MSTHRNQAKAIVEAWDILLRYRKHFIVPAFVVMTLVIVASLFLPRRYHAEAIFEQRTDMVLAEIIHRGGPKTFLDPRQRLTQELTGPPAVDRMIASLKAVKQDDGTPMYRDSELTRLKEDISQKILIKWDFASKEQHRVRVIYVGDHPLLARAAVNTLVENYIQRTGDGMEQRLRESRKFFDDEVTSSRTAIEELENQKLTFEIKHADLLPDNPVNIQMLAGDAAASMTAATQDVQSIKMRLAGLSEKLAATPRQKPSYVKVKNPELIRLEKQLKDARDQLSTYIDVYKMTAKHPDLTDMRQQVASIEYEIQQTAAEIVSERRYEENPQFADIELLVTSAQSDLYAAEQRVKSAKAQVHRYESQSANLFPVRAEYARVTRQVDQAQRQLAFWEENLRRVDMSLTAESGNRGVQLEFIKACEALWKPVSPDMTQVLMAAIMIALMSGTLSVIFAYRMDETFRDGDQLTATVEIPLLGAVSEIITTRQRAIRRARRLVVYPVHGLAMGTVLLVAFSLLFMNLKKPQDFAELMHSPLGWVQQRVAGNTEASIPARR